MTLLTSQKNDGKGRQVFLFEPNLQNVNLTVQMETVLLPKEPKDKGHREACLSN